MENNYQILMKYGEWLEVYFDEANINAHYRALNKHGAKLLQVSNIRAMTGKNPPYTYIIEIMMELLTEHEKFQFCTEDELKEIWSCIVQELREQGSAISEDHRILVEMIDHPGFDDFFKRFTHALQYSFKIRKTLRAFLNMIQASKQAWSRTLGKLHNTAWMEPGSIHKDQTRIDGDNVLYDITGSIETLIELYSALKDSFTFEDGEIVKSKVMEHPLIDQGALLPFDVYAVRLFFDFLSMGGQEYFGFCKHCGKFLLVQRKGRKQFCTDVCRSYFSLILHGKITPKEVR